MDIRDAAQVIEEVDEFSYLGFNNGELVQIDKVYADENLKQGYRDNKARIEKVKNTFTNPFEKSDANETRLINTDPTFIKDLKAYGDSWKSKNLLDLSDVSSTYENNGVTYNVVKNKDSSVKYIELSGTTTARSQWEITSDYQLPAGEYLFSQSEVLDTRLSCFLYYNDTFCDLQGSTESGFTLANDSIVTAVLDIRDANVNVDGAKIYPMIRLASVTDSTYEPYGLHTVEELNFDVCGGKNRFDTSKVAQGDYNNSEVQNRVTSTIDSTFYVKAGETYVISFDTSKLSHAWCLSTDKNNNLIEMLNGGYSAGSPHTITPTKDGYARIVFGKNDTNITPQDVKDAKVQLEKGSQATSYEPYVGHTTFTITPPRPLCKVGDVRDVLDVESGVWKYGNGIVDLGGLNWNYDESNKKFFTLEMPFYNNKGFGYTSALLTEKYKTVGNSFLDSTMENLSICGFGNPEGKSTILVKDTSYTNTTDFKNAMNGVNLIYELATPTTEPINPNDLSLLKTLQTYAPETNISITDQDGNEIDREFLYSSGAVGYAVDAGTVRGMDAYTIINDLLKRVEALENRPAPSGGGDGWNITVIDSSSDTKGGIFNE